GYSHTVHIEPPWLPLRQPECKTSDGRSPGSRLLPAGHLPGFPVVCWPSARRLQLRGQPRIGALAPFAAFPFEPRKGHRRLLDRGLGEGPSTGIGRLEGHGFGDQIEWNTLGEGFTWETQDRARDVAAAERAWAATKQMMANPAIRLIVLDELNIALRYDHLDIAEVVTTLQARRQDQHIVVTGRN